jgi:exodeoxyribonuclease VII small subunit
MENKTFEQLLKELQEIVNNLESGNLSLEDSVDAYQKGMAISLECKKRLDQAKEVVVKKVTDKEEVNF